MVSKLIDHIGFMVSNLEEAMDRWTKATGYDFRPPSKYTVKDYRDTEDPKPHLSDVRLSMSVQGPPYVELMEPYGTGTHSPRYTESFHHLGFNHEDAVAKREDLRSQGLVVNGEAFSDDGKLLLFFMDPRNFYGTRLEYNQTDIDHPWFDEATGDRITE